jgi:hypothetical protein
MVAVATLRATAASIITVKIATK